MQIGGDISTNKCDQCNSFLVWQEFVDHNHQDQSQLEEVCEECEVKNINKLESKAKIGTKVHKFLEQQIKEEV